MKPIYPLSFGLLLLLSACASTLVTPVGNLSYEPNFAPVLGLDNGNQGIGLGLSTNPLLTGENIYRHTDQNMKNLARVSDHFLPEPPDEETLIQLTSDEADPEQFYPESDQVLVKQNELTLLTMCIYGEARSESYEGKLAIGCVAMNRLTEGNWYGRNLREVLLKPLQFSCFNKNDPNYPKLFKPKANVWKDCFKAAWNSYSKLGDDPTLGSTHYCRYTITPKWVEQMKKMNQIGDHIFYKKPKTAMMDQWFAFANGDPSVIESDPVLQQELLKVGVLILSDPSHLTRWNSDLFRPSFNVHVQKVRMILEQTRVEQKIRL